MTVTFDVPPGAYAVSTLHDENKNNKMDTNAFGFPKEGYGASNNVVTHLHAASFDQAKFQVSDSGRKFPFSCVTKCSGITSIRHPEAFWDEH